MIDYPTEVRVHPAMTDAEVMEALRLMAPLLYRVTDFATRGALGYIAEYDACRLLGLTKAPALSSGYDAIDAAGRKLEIKAYTLDPGQDRPPPGGLVSRINVDAPTDAVLLVIYDQEAHLVEIRETPMSEVRTYLSATNSSARKDGRMRARALYDRGIMRWSRSVPTVSASANEP
jgi:hypothetical protein